MIVAVPSPTALTDQFMLTVATFASLLFQVTFLLFAFEGLTEALSNRLSPVFMDTLVLFRLIPVTGWTTVMEHAAFFPLPSFATAVMVAVPLPTAFTWPVELTVTTLVLLLFHVRPLLFALKGLTEALSDSVFPVFMDSLVLFRLMPVTGCVTVIVQELLFPLPSFAVAVMDAVPFPTARTVPLESTVATLVLLLLQVTLLLLASHGLTTAPRDMEPPLFMDALALFILSPVTGCLTVTLQDAFFQLPSLAVAVMVALPFPTAFTAPYLLTVTTLGLLLLQVTLLLSAFHGLTVALSPMDPPFFMTTANLLSLIFVTRCITVTLHLYFFPFTFAVIVAVPFFLPVTTPLELTVATFLLLLFHLTFAFVPVTFRAMVWYIPIVALLLLSLTAASAFLGVTPMSSTISSSHGTALLIILLILKPSFSFYILYLSRFLQIRRTLRCCLFVLVLTFFWIICENV